MSTQADALAGDPAVALTENASVSPRWRNARRGAIAILVLLVCAAAFQWWPSDGVQVPDVVGRPRTEAQAIMAWVGLPARIVFADVPGIESGIVVKQSEGATSKVDEGSTITLTVASGKLELPTDALLGATYDQAAVMLRSLGLQQVKSRRSQRASRAR